MKKFTASVLIFIMILAFTACGGEKAPGGAAPAKPVKIGVMQFGEFTALQDAFRGFKDGLAEAGFVDGENIIINYLSAAADPANCPTIADALINDGSDLILAIATPSVSCLKEKTVDIPVLFTAVTDPVGSGFFEDANKPGGNISGSSDMNPVAEQIDLLKELLPDAKSVAVFYCSSESNSAIQFALAKEQIEKLGMSCVQKTISAIDEAKSAIESLKGSVDAIYIPTDNTISDSMTLVAATANECGIPTIVAEPGEVLNGGTATIGINYYELGKQTAKMAVEIINSDDPLAAVANMPVIYQTDNCETAINQAGIEALGLDVPESILKRATVY